VAQLFQYYTCDGLDFYITTTSVATQGGTLMVSWDAMGCATKQKISTVLQLSSLPFALVHASSSTTLKFSIDSPSIQHSMCTSGSENSLGDLGILVLSIANGLNAPAETSQKIQINVWVQFRNPKFSFYTIKHDLVMSQMLSLEDLPGIESLEAIVAQGKWLTTSDINLLELTVHPTACAIKDGLVTQTPLSVISSLFSRWCGSLKYRFVFGASQFVKGKIIVSSIPVQFRETKLSIEQIASFPSTICDLSSETREFSFEVPYISIGEDSFVTRDALYDVSSYNAQFVVSRLHMVILDPLVMNANASNSVSFFVTVAPGTNFELRQLSGVKSEYVKRTVKQSFGTALQCSGILGRGFNDWCRISSVLMKFNLDSASKNALHLHVSPFYRSMAPCTTALSWLTQIFVAWTGSLEYTFRSHSNKVKINSYVRIWHDVNGSTRSGEECEFLSEVDPPAGAHVVYWYPGQNPELKLNVPYRARTPKLLITKARYTPDDADWVHYYNGTLIVDYEGVETINVELSIACGKDFEMFEQTVPPRCGKVSSAFTKLSYESKLSDISAFPSNKARLGGPTNKAIVTPVAFAKVTPVNDDSKASQSSSLPSASRSYKPVEGDVAVDEDGEPIIFSGGEWVFDEGVEAQMMGCFPNMKEAKSAMKMLKQRETCSKMADMVDKGHAALCGADGSLIKITDMAADMMPQITEIVDKSHSVFCTDDGPFDKLGGH